MNTAFGATSIVIVGSILAVVVSGCVAGPTSGATAGATASATASTQAGLSGGDAIEQPLAGLGDVSRGRTLAFDRESACTLCHQLPAEEPTGTLPAGGDLGPPLAGTGGRWSTAQLRLRLVDPARLNPQTIMPAYLRHEGLVAVASKYQGRTILNEQQIEDLVAWLSTLK